MDLFEEIRHLICLKTEGDYWDFKSEWHSNNADLLHDIICMANNVVSRDAYLIIGVSDSKHPGGVKIRGVPSAQRKSQQAVIDFLKSIEFAGGVRPTVYVQTLSFDEGDVDVIIIKNSNHTPFFLLEPYNSGKECVRAGYIYTRIGDTNTPKTKIADIDKIEYLWRKRFGIDLSATEKLLRLLDSPDDWMGDFNIGESKYHSTFPEYQIRLKEITDQDEYRRNDILRNLADHHCDKGFSVCELVVLYHTTILHSTICIYLDGYRHLIPFPHTDTVYRDHFAGSFDTKHSITYLYFERSSVDGKLFECLATTKNNWYGEKWHLQQGVGFLIFDDETDREKFNRFVLFHLDSTLHEYEKCLTEKGYIHTVETEEYFYTGWSKGNEIKAQYLYECFLGKAGSSFAAMIPNFPKKKIVPKTPPEK